MMACCAPLLCLVFLLCFLVFDEIELFALEPVLILSFLRVASHSFHDRAKSDGVVLRGGRDCSMGRKAWEDVLTVGACVPFRKFVIVRGDGETSLEHLSLVNA